MTAEPAAVTYGRRLADLAQSAPDAVAVRYLRADGTEEVVRRSTLDRWANRLARWLESRGAATGRWVVIAIPNEPLHVALALGAWRAGAGVLPLNYRMPPLEAERVLRLVDAAVVVADWDLAHPALASPHDTLAADQLSEAPLPDRIASPSKAVASGGSTGRPKIIVDPNPWVERPGGLARRYGPLTGFRPGQTQLVSGPLYHNAPFSWAHYGLFEEHELVLLDRFDAARALDAIERHRVQWACLVPTMMQRMLREQHARPRPLTTLEGVLHTAAPCPAWVKRGWIDLAGADRLFEAYGSTEGIGSCVIRGDEWLEHPNSVGRPIDCDLEIRDGGGRRLPTGQVGEIFSRPHAVTPTFRYLGATAELDAEGFASVGDLGWLDDEGFLYLADRRTDLIVTGAVNVYPAEVEAALSEHPAVRDVVVIGLHDPEWGRRVHAIIEPADQAAPPLVADLDRWCRARLSPPKVPKSFEVVQSLPRNEAGKIQRAALVRDRDAPES